MLSLTVRYSIGSCLWCLMTLWSRAKALKPWMLSDVVVCVHVMRVLSFEGVLACLGWLRKRGCLPG